MDSANAGHAPGCDDTSDLADAPADSESADGKYAQGHPPGTGSEESSSESPVTSEPDAISEFEDTLRPVGRRSWVVDSVRAQNSFIGTTTIGSVVIGDDRNHYPVPLTDLVALHERDRFVEPPGYDDLTAALREPRIVVCHGPDGCGKELAVTRALGATGIHTVRLLPVSFDVTLIRRVIEAAAESGGAFVLPGLDDAGLRALAGIAGQPVQALVSQGKIKVVVTTGSAPSGAVSRKFAIAAIGYPEAGRVLGEYCQQLSLGPEVKERAAKALGLLVPPSSPAVITAIADQAAANRTLDPKDLADSFTGALSANAVQSWVTPERKPREIAMLVAGASLPGASVMIAQEQAERLCAKLTEVEHDRGTLVFGQSAGWPTGLLCVATEQRGTHFGVQALDVVDIQEPHQPHDVIQAIWRSLGASFHGAYCEWLAALPADKRLRWHAAYTVGVLFATDPRLIEERVLRPWIQSRNLAAGRCAGLALGVPTAIGADCASARKLAHSWATSGNIWFQHAAIAAYGGLLGTWDTASAAPLKLILIGQVTPELRQDSDSAMAGLIVQGPEAVAARTTVISYLTLAAGTQATRAHAFGCLPAVARMLNSPNPVCAESFAALRAEEDNWAALTALLSDALVSAWGREPGQAALATFVRAIAAGQTDYEVVEDIIRRMKRAQRPFDKVGRLRDSVRRTLVLLSRADADGLRDVATGLLNQFFG